MLSVLRTLDPFRGAAPGREVEAMTTRRRLGLSDAIDALSDREKHDIGLDGECAPQVHPVTPNGAA